MAVSDCFSQNGKHESSGANVRKEKVCGYFDHSSWKSFAISMQAMDWNVDGMKQREKAVMTLDGSRIGRWMWNFQSGDGKQSANPDQKSRGYRSISTDQPIRALSAEIRGFRHLIIVQMKNTNSSIAMNSIRYVMASACRGDVRTT